MSNTYFQFKQFRVNQVQSAMKVCTDACIFGAFVPVKAPGNILDVGAGTGLLSLMAAQRCHARITAVEINKAAANEAAKNIRKSPFSRQVRVINSSIQEYALSATEKYDLIISNPPFFKNNLHSEDLEKNQAFHSSTLSFDELIICVEQLLSYRGEFWILLPPFESEVFKRKAKERRLHPGKNIKIYDKPGSKVLRHISSYSYISPGQEEASSFIIKDATGKYSEDFEALLKDYYLIF